MRPLHQHTPLLLLPPTQLPPTYPMTGCRFPSHWCPHNATFLWPDGKPHTTCFAISSTLLMPRASLLQCTLKGQSLRRSSEPQEQQGSFSLKGQPHDVIAYGSAPRCPLHPSGRGSFHFLLLHPPLLRGEEHLAFLEVHCCHVPASPPCDTSKKLAEKKGCYRNRLTLLHPSAEPSKDRDWLSS